MKGVIPEISLKYKKGTIERIKCNSVDDTAKAIRKMFDADQIDYREEAIVLYLNGASETIAFLKLSSGGLNGSVIDTRQVFTHALLCGASHFILAHNHPSGSVYPSKSDIEITQQLHEASQIMQITLVDHFIISSESYYSMTGEGLIHNYE